MKINLFGRFIMKKVIEFKDFLNIDWFNNFTKKDIIIIKEQFLNFPEKQYLNLAIFQFDLFEYNNCEDYQYIINRLFHKVINRYPDFKINNVNCLKKNKLEVIIKDKKYKKAFRVNGSRFDIETLFEFLNSILLKNNIHERFFLLHTLSDIQYPILASPSLIERAKELGIIAIL
jgi:hypothetical protein